MYNYKKEIDGLVSPVLAECIIDGKVGLKELIMTTIIDLHIRGNIEIINNEIIKFISYNNLETYEKEIVELLFEKNDMIRFTDINDTFAKSNQGTVLFSKKITNIKNSIHEKISITFQL